MRTEHLSAWEQDEYLMGQQTPAAVQHLAACEDCRLAVGRMEQGMALFRTSAKEWSAETLRTRPAKPVPATRKAIFAPTLGWAVAAILLLMALLPLGWWKPKERQPMTATTKSAVIEQDDALLEQVDAQVSAAVPSSMESLAYPTSAGESNTRQAAHAAGNGGMSSAN